MYELAEVWLTLVVYHADDAAAILKSNARRHLLSLAMTYAQQALDIAVKSDFFKVSAQLCLDFQLGL